MAVVFVSGHSQTGTIDLDASGNATLDWSATFTPTSGNALVLTVSVPTNNVTSWSLPAGWVIANSGGLGTGSLAGFIAYKENCSSSDTSILVDGNADIGAGRYSIREYSGGKTSGLSDANGKAEDEANITTATASQSTGTTGTLSQANGLGIAFICVDNSNNVGSVTWSDSWSEVAAINGGTGTGHYVAELAISATTAQSATLGTFSTSDQAYGSILVLYEATTGYTLTASAGSFTLTGIDAGLIAARYLTADSGTFALTGYDAGLIAERLLTAASGTFALTGYDATLTYSPAGAYTLTAESGAFALTGYDATFIHGYSLTADAGAFTLTGNDAGLTYGRAILCETGVYALTGFDATLDYSGAVSSAALSAPRSINRNIQTGQRNNTQTSRRNVH